MGPVGGDRDAGLPAAGPCCWQRPSKSMVLSHLKASGAGGAVLPITRDTWTIAGSMGSGSEASCRGPWHSLIRAHLCRYINWSSSPIRCFPLVNSNILTKALREMGSAPFTSPPVVLIDSNSRFSVSSDNLSSDYQRAVDKTKCLGSHKNIPVKELVKK